MDHQTATSNGTAELTTPAPCQALDLDTPTVCTPESNRQATLESVSDLLASMKLHGQLVLGIVASHPTKPGSWLCLDGNRRLLCCRILGLKFRAVRHEGEITEASLAITRIATNNIREKMTDMEVAADLQRIMDAHNCSQAEAGERAGGICPSEVSKIMSFGKRAIPELIAAVEARTICRDVGRIISRLASPEQQKEVLERAVTHNMKRDAVDVLVRQMNGKKVSKEKPIKARTPKGLQAIIPASDYDCVLGELATLTEAVRKAQKHGLPLASLPALLKGT